MKRLTFRSKEAFLKKLDGKVYAVCNKKGRYLCDIIEDDYLRLLHAGVLVNLDDDLGFAQIDAESSVIITLDLDSKACNDFREKYGLQIEIEGSNKHPLIKPVDYELDYLILKSSADESETAFVFMDGIAVEIESLDSSIPVVNPVILTYPHRQQVLNNVRMREEIEHYRGHSWDGDYYSIALLYGEEHELK